MGDISFGILFALKTHFDPTIFTPGGSSTISQVPASCSVVNSLANACSQSGQSRQHFASAREDGSRTSASAISVSIASSSLRSMRSPSRMAIICSDSPHPAMAILFPDYSKVRFLAICCFIGGCVSHKCLCWCQVLEPDCMVSSFSPHHVKLTTCV